MKRIIIVLMLLPLMMVGQINPKDYDISTSRPYEVADAQSKYYFSVGDQVMMVKIQRKAVVVQKYDVESKKLSNRKDLPALEKGAVLENIDQVGDDFYLFYSLWDKKNTLEQLYARKINFDKSTMDKPVRLIKINGKITGSWASSGFSLGGFGISLGVVDKFSFSSSFDGSKYVVQYRKKPKKRSDKINKDEIGMYVFDSNLKEVWTGEFTMPYTEAQMNNIDYDVDSKGNAYILAEVYDSEVSKKYIKKEKNYHLEMLKIRDSKIEKIQIQTEDYHINNIWMHEGSDNSMYMTGFYNEEKGYFKNVDGVFLMKLDQDGEIETSSHHKIPLDIINQFKKARTQKKNAKKDKKGKLDFENLVLREIILKEDGSVTLIGEQYFVRVYTDSKGNKRYTYYYQDILVTKIDADGELVWMKKLPKRQKGSAPRGGMGYEHMSHQGNDYFFYVDNDKNIDLATDQEPKYHLDGLGGILTAYKIEGESGKVSKSSIVDFKLAPVKGSKPMPIYQFNTGRIIRTSKGMIFEVYKKKKEDVMVHVEFE